MSNFENFGKTAKKPKAVAVPDQFRQLHVRLSLDDAVRVKHAAERNGHTNQSALVEAINRLMAEWGEPVVSDVGSAGKLLHRWRCFLYA